MIYFVTGYGMLFFFRGGSPYVYFIRNEYIKKKKRLAIIDRRVEIFLTFECEWWLFSTPKHDNFCIAVTLNVLIGSAWIFHPLKYQVRSFLLKPVRWLGSRISTGKNTKNNGTERHYWTAQKTTTTPKTTKNQIEAWFSDNEIEKIRRPLLVIYAATEASSCCLSTTWPGAARSYLWVSECLRTSHVVCTARSWNYELSKKKIFFTIDSLVVRFLSSE